MMDENVKNIFVVEGIDQYLMASRWKKHLRSECWSPSFISGSVWLKPLHRVLIFFNTQDSVKHNSVRSSDGESLWNIFFYFILENSCFTKNVLFLKAQRNLNSIKLLVLLGN